MDDGVGKTLREARERRGLDLAEVEATLRIRVPLLRALEGEEWELLPGEAYARGFIRTYGDFLGLDGEQLAERRRRAVAPPAERQEGIAPSRLRRAWPPLPRLLAIAALAVLAATLAAAVISGGGSSGAPESRVRGEKGAAAAAPPSTAARPARPQSVLSLRLTATAEVWVCLLDAGGEPLVDGQILSTGSVAGPFRSGSFTVSLGNGGVSMTVNGKQASIAATPSPVGYTIGSGGAMRELAEGERPDCA